MRGKGEKERWSSEEEKRIVKKTMPGETDNDQMNDQEAASGQM